MTKTTTKFRSPIAAAVHEGVSDMYELGLVDKETMHEFDVRCLTQIEGLTAKEIAAMREDAGLTMPLRMARLQQRERRKIRRDAG